MSLFTNIFGGASAASALGAAQAQQNLAAQQGNSQQQYNGTTSYILPQGINPYSIPNIYYGGSATLDIDAHETSIEKDVSAHKSVLEKKELIDSLHPKTKDIMRLVTEIQRGSFKDVTKLDKYVREQLFNSKFNDFVNGDSE